MESRRVAVLHTSRTRPSALVDPVVRALAAAGRKVSLVSVTSGQAVALDGHCAVVVLSPEQPSLRSHHGVWREWDRWHATTVPWLTSVARSAGARRLVLQSSALQYADGAGVAVDERAPLGVTPATEPWCAAETAAYRFGDGSHSTVVLRLAPLTDDPAVAPWLEAAAERPGSCPQARWQPRLTTREAAQAVERSLQAPGGIYNVGFSEAGPGAGARQSAGRWLNPPPVGDLLPWRERTSDRLEPYTRSIRLSPEKFERTTGWHPARAGAGSRG